MADITEKNLAADDFNAEKFVKDLGAYCVGAEELAQKRASIQRLSDATSAQLKRNVYQNYMQFIETAKEISHLESEMYQLSQLLSEQRTTLSMLSTQALGVVYNGGELDARVQDSDDLVAKEEDTKLKLKQLLDNVEGAMSLVETPGRVCLHEGSLLELDPVEGTPLKRIHAYLFNDVLTIASWLATGGRRGPPRYKMQAVYDLESLAIVNVKDLGTVKLAFKLLAFPDTRVFQCPTATSKKEWLEKCEMAKKAQMTQEQAAEPSGEGKISKQDSTMTIRSMSLDSYGMDDVRLEDDASRTSEEAPPEWMLEVAEDLDSYIAQRHFEQAYALLERARAYIKEEAASNLKDLKSKLDDRANHLVQVLTKELESSAQAKSLQGGGLRSARRAVKLLILLGKSAQACQLYLKLCSAALKARLKRVKREGATIPYVQQLSAIAFSNIVEMSREYLKIFTPETNCTSALIVWCSQEIKHLTSHLIKQMFIPQVPLSTLVECIATVRDHCDQLIQFGMDFRYQLDGQLRTPLARALQDTGEKYIDAIKLRASEDNWRPYSLQTNHNLKKLLAELDDLGIAVPSDCCQSNESRLTLTANTVAFAKMYVSLLEDCLSVMTPQLMLTISDLLFTVMRAQVQHIVTSLTNPRFKQERKIMQDNASYVRNVIILRGLELYKGVTGQRFSKLAVLQEQIILDAPSLSAQPPKPKPRTSIPKYSTMEYL